MFYISHTWDFNHIVWCLKIEIKNHPKFWMLWALCLHFNALNHMFNQMQKLQCSNTRPECWREKWKIKSWVCNFCRISLLGGKCERKFMQKRIFGASRENPRLGCKIQIGIWRKLKIIQSKKNSQQLVIYGTNQVD